MSDFANFTKIMNFSGKATNAFIFTTVIETDSQISHYSS